MRTAQLTRLLQRTGCDTIIDNGCRQRNIIPFLFVSDIIIHTAFLGIGKYVERGTDLNNTRRGGGVN